MLILQHTDLPVVPAPVVVASCVPAVLATPLPSVPSEKEAAAVVLAAVEVSPPAVSTATVHNKVLRQYFPQRKGASVDLKVGLGVGFEILTEMRYQNIKKSVPHIGMGYSLIQSL